MKKARMNISHSRFILFKLKIFGEIVTTYILFTKLHWPGCQETVRVKLPPAHLFTTHGRSFTMSILIIAERQAGKL